ncbi:variant 2, E3 ubiquitin-protein ligase tom1 [Lathyrus oleraceus]|uniref:Variant 2, E3 ubiquitin-protein ligase tom1 n=1 Tax=Pisum sativum TaxID=3888 RepID=A0A9D4X6V9_PEA|nr:variant 2, E3 ubiquitin-protein ligase tom1 [Pisum sativum]
MRLRNLQLTMEIALFIPNLWWWDKINNSTIWQNSILYFLSAAYALFQLVRIELRVPEYGWTTQKIFHLMNFIVNGDDNSVVEFFGKTFVAGVSFVAALGFLLYGGRSDLLQPSVSPAFYYDVLCTVKRGCKQSVRQEVRGKYRESEGHNRNLDGQHSKSHQMLNNSLYDASLDVLDHPILDLVYYMLVEILPSALVLYILRKLPPRRISAQYHPIH